MNIRELITELEKYTANTPVFIYVSDEEGISLDEPKVTLHRDSATLPFFRRGTDGPVVVIS